MEINGNDPLSSFFWALTDHLFKKCVSAMVLHLFHYMDTVFIFVTTKGKSVLLPTTIRHSLLWKSEYIKLVGFWLYCLGFDSDGIVFS